MMSQLLFSSTALDTLPPPCFCSVQNLSCGKWSFLENRGEERTWGRGRRRAEIFPRRKIRNCRLDGGQKRYWKWRLAIIILVRQLLSLSYRHFKTWNIFGLNLCLIMTLMNLCSVGNERNPIWKGNCSSSYFFPLTPSPLNAVISARMSCIVD